MAIDKKTKIVATLGPATDTKEILKDMILAGANVFRINFSHADYEDVKEKNWIYSTTQRRIRVSHFYFS